MKDRHCSTCGEKLHPLYKRTEGWGYTAVLEMDQHRTMRQGRSEHRPQLIASAFVYRNGGSQDPVCDGCTVIGLKDIRERVDWMIEALAPPS